MSGYWLRVFGLLFCLVCWSAWGCESCQPPVGQDGSVDASNEPQSEPPTVVDRPDTSPDVSVVDTPDKPGECKPQPLLDHPQWKPVERADDPYKDLAPAGACGDVSYKLEDGVLEVETGNCSFLTMSQPLPLALKAGDKLRLIFWHLQLTTASSAVAYLGLRLGDTPIFKKEIPLPAEPEVYEQTLTIERDVPAKTTLYFHLHNHGSNSWKLLSLDRLCPGQ